jgi:hypothetical protein
LQRAADDGSSGRPPPGAAWKPNAIACATRLAAITAASRAAASPGAYCAKKKTIVACVVPSPWTEIGSTETRNTTGSVASASTNGTRTSKARSAQNWNAMSDAMCGTRTMRARA